MRLTLVNQFYAPNISPTAQLAASLAESRARLGDQVTVVAGTGGYAARAEAGPIPSAANRASIDFGRPPSGGARP